MKRSELLDEIANGVKFWGWDEAGVLVGVMGLQNVLDVTLIRHAYVRPSYSAGPASKQSDFSTQTEE